jgi:hypothetical protein
MTSYIKQKKNDQDLIRLGGEQQDIREFQTIFADICFEAANLDFKAIHSDHTANLELIIHE